MSDLLDVEITTALAGYGGGIMTYVVANRLRMLNRNRHGKLKTDKVLRKLKAMEAAGQVERVPTTYARQLCWRLAPEAKASGVDTDSTGLPDLPTPKVL